MNIMRVPPAWRLPQGVDAPLWEYTHTSRLAAEEDAYFANHPLFQADAARLTARFVEPGRLVDLGCGAGRHSLRFAARGFSVTAVDLSRPMLEMVDLKAVEQGIELTTVQSNLCRLGCFPDQVFDYALSMFSTLGMIRGRECRVRALAEARRILRPGGRISLHVHNFWLNLRDSQGRRWPVAGSAGSLRPGEPGRSADDLPRNSRDESSPLSVGRARRASSHGAGLEIREVLPLNEVSAAVIDVPWFAPSVRAGGWIVFAGRALNRVARS